MADVVALSSVWDLAAVPCVCGSKHTILVSSLAVKGYEQTCFAVCPNVACGVEPCALCLFYWRARLRKAMRQR